MSEKEIVTQKEKKETKMYPHPYKVKNNCLYVEKNSNQGTYDQKLCNFIAWLVSEITIDDGAEETKRLKISGRHQDGRELKEIEIQGNEFATFNWIMEKWGVDCNLETGGGVKEHIRYAIQSTAQNAYRQTVYMVTGWKKIDGTWHFLMPGDEKYTVRLDGNLSHYEMEHCYGENDLRLTMNYMKNLVAPKEVVYPLMAYTFLCPLNEFLRKSRYEPKFVMMMIGKTGTRKSTLSALFLSFFGKFTATDLPLSFRDTANSILLHTFTLKDVLTCIDDFHPCGKKEETKLTATAQAIMRAYGDRSGRGRLKADSTPIDSKPPKGNAIVTAEFAPDIGESGTARYRKIY